MCHSFVAGDLVIDHSIYVRETTPDHQQINDERICEVVRRVDTAGGAANCARALAVLSTGKTYLWGIVGQSQWGAFHEILKSSQEKDSSATNIEFRGVRDETDAQMNTVSRLVITHDEGGDRSLDFGDRFDEVGRIHVPPGKGIRSYLESAQEELRGQLEVIVINDLDYGCLTRSVIEEIAKFAESYNILLFVDPKYDVEKYQTVRSGTAILPNLVEWCCLVGEKGNEDVWRGLIRSGSDLCKMAYQSLFRLGNFEYHIIKCDRDGAILIAPESESHCAVYRVHPYPIHDSMPHQLGRGDVMTAAFAMQLQRLLKERPTENRTKLALLALLRSNVVVGCYRTMDWHHMPYRVMVDNELKEAERNPARSLEPSFAKRVGSPRRGISYLPKAESIILARYKTIVPGWFTFSDDFRSQLEALFKDCASDDTRHIILGALPGSGKSQLLATLKGNRELSVEIAPKVRDPENARDETSKYLTSFLERQTRERIVAIDEALSRGFENKDFAKIWLDSAESRGVRLLLVDQSFVTTNFLNDVTNFEVKRRSNFHGIPRLDQRPLDISLFVAGKVFDGAPRIAEARIRGDFLLAFIDALLEVPDLNLWASQLMQAVKSTWKSTQVLKLSGDNLPPGGVKSYLDEQAGSLVKSTWFEFAPDE